MTSSLIRRLTLVALVLVAATLLALNYTLTSYSEHLQGVAVDRAVRMRVLEISLAAALLAALVAVLVSRSLTARVRRLKRAAEGLLGLEAGQSAIYDSSDDLGSLERSLAG